LEEYQEYQYLTVAIQIKIEELSWHKFLFLSVRLRLA